MELKNTEQTVDELLDRYHATRQGLLQLKDSALLEKDATVFPELESRVPKEENDEEAATTAAVSSSSLPELVASLQHIRSTLGDIQPTITKFRKRLEETDPVTGNPRYGEKTQQRVQVLVDAYDRLSGILPPTSHEDDNAPMSLEVLMTLSSKVQHEAEEKAKQEAIELEQQRQKEEEERRLEEEALRRQKEQEEKERQERALEEQRANELLRQRAEVARQQRLERESADQRWADSVGRGVDAVKTQLKILKEATASDPEAQKVALASLLQLFSQIQKFPEETNYRRIRRSHEQFQQDIGRHKGGQEVLLAAGFEPGAIDDVPCFICREPDLEKEMDKWSEWFDLLKATHQILQEEQP
jgi:DNA repair exonuclease SbcCD ATPase subunit